MNAINKKGLKEIKVGRNHKKWRYENLKKKLKTNKPTWRA